MSKGKSPHQRVTARKHDLRKRGLLPPVTLYSLDEAVIAAGIRPAPKEAAPMNKTLSVQVDGASDDSLPVYRGRECIGWLSRSVVRYYNVHRSLGQNVYGVGEAEWSGEKIWIFDRTCFQWAEFTQIPSVLSLE